MPADTTLSISDLIAREAITMTTAAVDRNPHLACDGWAASHYRCTFRAGGRQFTAYFSMGAAYTARPTVADVLDCLATDAASVEDTRGFEDWAAELGYDPDSRTAKRTAKRTYQAIQRQSAKLRAFLGDAAFQALLYECERL